MKKNQFAGRRWLTALLALTALGIANPIRVEAADHRDGRLLSGVNTLYVGNLDLNDLYVFQGRDPRNTVMVMTAGPAAGVLSPPVFHPGALYEFRIDNTGDFVDDLLIQVVFSDPDSFFRQTYQVRFFNIHTGAMQILATGMTGQPSFLRSGGALIGAVQPGIYDDPFFFNGSGYAFFRSTALGEMPLPPGTTPISMLVPPAAPVDTFANFNTLAIVLEVRSGLLTNAGNPNIKVWIRTLTPEGLQIDRTALPAINTAAVPTALQPVFNVLTPSDDPALRPIASEFIQNLYGLDAATADGLAMTALPDMMPFNVNSSAGFNNGLTLTLNGRRLTDDVIDAEFNALTAGALKGDNVINDSVFRTGFPYLGTPLPPPTVPGSGFGGL